MKSRQSKGKESRYIEELPASLNPESIRGARVLLCDVSNQQYTGKVDRGLKYHPSILHLSGGVPVSKVDATGDWVHLASLVELIKGIKQRWINHMPFYLRGLVRMVPMDHLHHILLYAAFTESKSNIQIGVDASAYVSVRACQYKGELHEHIDADGNSFGFQKNGQLYKSRPYITALFSYAEVVEACATQDTPVYKYEASDNFIMPLDRCPAALQANDMYPTSDQVLSLKIKVQTAQQVGMIVLPTTDRLIKTSGVPLRSIVGAMDHKGRHLDLKSLTTLLWQPTSSQGEQAPYQRGLCYLPSLEVFREYRVTAEHTEGAGHLLELPAFVPSQHKNLRANRSPDAAGTHPDMLYCEFKGCTIIVYGKIGKCPVGSNSFPGWDTTTRPARQTAGTGSPRAKARMKASPRAKEKTKARVRISPLTRYPRARAWARGEDLVKGNPTRTSHGLKNRTQKDPM